MPRNIPLALPRWETPHSPPRNGSSSFRPIGKTDSCMAGRNTFVTLRTSSGSSLSPRARHPESSFPPAPLAAFVCTSRSTAAAGGTKCRRWSSLCSSSHSPSLFPPSLILVAEIGAVIAVKVDVKRDGRPLPHRAVLAGACLFHPHTSVISISARGLSLSKYTRLPSMLCTTVQQSSRSTPYLTRMSSVACCRLARSRRRRSGT